MHHQHVTYAVFLLFVREKIAVVVGVKLFAVQRVFAVFFLDFTQMSVGVVNNVLSHLLGKFLVEVEVALVFVNGFTPVSIAAFLVAFYT